MISNKLAAILLIACAFLLGHVENKAIFGIGMRLIGDQLLVRDVLQSPPVGLAEHPTIGFNYAIPDPITYIEILSEDNVLAEVNFSYEHDLVKGTVTAIAGTGGATTSAIAAALAETENATTTSITGPFEVLITIYGFNDTVLNMNSAYILNRNQQFEGRLEPQQTDEEDYDVYEEDEYEDLSNADVETTAKTSQIDAERNASWEEVSTDSDADFEHADKIIEVGQRQPGDYLIYDTHQTSPSLTQLPTNHSVIFYYIDSDFITYAKFVIFDHYVGKTGPDYVAPVAEYSHFSPHTLKAIVTDSDTTSLFVQMLLFGYSPLDRPFGYVPFLANGGDTTDAPMSPLQRLKLLMQAETSGSFQIVQHPDEEDSSENSTQQLPLAPNASVCATNGVAFFTTPAFWLIAAAATTLRITV